MNLRTQMLLAGALTLAVPIIGWQSVKQLDESLRQTRVDAQSLKVANARLALAESEDLRAALQAGNRPSASTDLYAQFSNAPLFVDGYSDEWSNLIPFSTEFTNQQDSLTIRFATQRDRLFLFARINDNAVVYHQPPAPRFNLAEGEQVDQQAHLVNGDAIELLVTNSRGDLEHVLFRSVAPGPVVGLTGSKSADGASAGRQLRRYNGFWAATPEGFQFEASMPLPPLASNIAVAFIDVDDQGQSRTRWLGTASTETMQRFNANGLRPSSNGDNVVEIDTARNDSSLEERVVVESVPSRDVLPGRLFYTASIANKKLEPWVTLGTRARLFDRQGRLLSDVNSLYEKTEEEFEYDPAQRGLFNAILFRIFAYFVADPEVNGQPFELTDALHLPPEQVDDLASNEAETKHYVTNERDIVLGTLMPIGGEQPNGFLLFESNEDLASAYSASRVARLFSLLTLVSLLAGLVLLIYASLLSMRIRALSQLATKAVADDGRVRGLPQSDAKDEIGDLSRNLSALLDRSANYTKYLEALSSRLSHELRTPLSVVKTSIENMDRDKLDDETVTLMDRASGGADQLSAIIRALVESTRLEQTVQQSQMEEVDVLEWFQGSMLRYKQVYPDVSFLSAVSYADDENQPAIVFAAAELLQQAFDKLIHNAVGFSDDGQLKLVLKVFVENAQQVVLIAVENSGSQIPEDRQAQLFDPMFSDRTKDDGELHLGLGLYIVRMIAEAHQGRVSVGNMRNGVQVGMIIPCHQ